MKRVNSGRILSFLPLLSVVQFVLCCHSAASAQRAAPSFIAKAYCAGDRVHILDSEGSESVPPRLKDQAGCSSPVVAADKQTVGWLVEYWVGTQSYPIPTDLVIYRSGKIVRRLQSGWMIWDWHFWKGGTQVAYSAGTTHGVDHPLVYELYSIKTGRLLEKIEGAALEKPLPAWAAKLSK